MPASRCNYLMVYDNSPQVFAASTLETILGAKETKETEGVGRTILFTSYFPDEEKLMVFEVTEEELEAKRVEIAEKEVRVAEKRRLKEKAQEDGES